MRNASLLLTLTIFVLFPGCAPLPKIVTSRTTTEMYRLFANDFEGFEVPQTNKIKVGEHRGFPYAEFDEVWDAAMIVSMQQGAIIRLSKESGIIVVIGSLPLCLLVERSGPVTVYINIIEDLHGRADDPKEIVSEFRPRNLKKILETYLDKLAIQLYAGQKWKYLYSDKGK